MKKQAAAFFVYLICFQYVLGIVATVVGANDVDHHHTPNRRIVRNTKCRLTPQLEIKLNDCFDRIQASVSDAEELPDQMLEEYELTQGTAIGFSDFRRGPYRCSCGRNLVRIHVQVEFVRILLTFVLSLVEDLLDGLLGNLGSSLAKTIGNVVNLLVRILALRIICQVRILQRFIPGTKCVLESFEVSRVITIRILGLDLAPLVELLSPLLTPIVSALLRSILNDRVKVVFQREIERITIFQTEVHC